jgi:hypothetical protein
MTKVTVAALRIERPVSCQRIAPAPRAAQADEQDARRHACCVLAERCYIFERSRPKTNDSICLEQVGRRAGQLSLRWRNLITASSVRVLAWSFSMMRLT